ncbi:MAG: HD domain-containing protein [Candidatus Falkowbacteria bacterium]|nr:HD domain-containing protein [Candidatus Falkowbacteria bacterium]
MVIPVYILELLQKLEKKGFEAYIVGGCVRDFLLGREPQDWDLTTNATPEEILAVFPEGKYENQFGTVLLPLRKLPDNSGKGELIDVIEITTYRSEQGYSDRRHPDEVLFETEIDKDLERRDFTINALALRLAVKGQELKAHRELLEIDDKSYELVDLFRGRRDLKDKIIRAVGEPTERFKEDALRMMRAIRFSSQLGFEIEAKTQRAILKLAGAVKFVSKERVRDELVKIIKSGRPAAGIRLMHDCKLLQYIIPELEEGVAMDQNHHHIYQVFDHNVNTLKHCPSADWQVRLAGLFHDIGKPKTRKFIDGAATFYNHEYVGARQVERIMKRLKFSTDDSLRVVNLVKNHMFYYNVGEVTAASVRRLIVKVGRENLKDLIDLRIADRLGSGTPKGMPYKLRHLEYMLEKVQNDPISVKMLAVNGYSLMSELKLEPGPKIGAILDVLLSEVIEDPELNKKDYLLEKARQLESFNLAELREQAREKIDSRREEDDNDLKKSFHV